MLTQILRPNADVGGWVWATMFPNDGIRWNKISEVIPDEDATYIQGSLGSTSHNFSELEAPIALGTIVSVIVSARVSNPSAWNEQLNLALRLNAVIRYNTNLFLVSGWPYGNWSDTIGRPGGGAWSWADIAILQGGLRQQGSGFLRCTQLYVSVNYQTLPTVTTDPASAIGVHQATLNGTLTNDGGMACDCGFEWGETVAYGNTTPTQSRTTGQVFAQTIMGLEHNRAYHFRAFATNIEGTSYGADQTFTTLSEAPTVTTLPATGVT